MVDLIVNCYFSVLLGRSLAQVEMFKSPWFGFLLLHQGGILLAESQI